MARTKNSKTKRAAGAAYHDKGGDGDKVVARQGITFEPRTFLSFATTPVLEIRSPAMPAAGATIPNVNNFTITVFSYPTPLYITATLVAVEGDMDILPGPATLQNHQATFTFDTTAGTSGHLYMLWVEAGFSGQTTSVNWDKRALA